MNITLRLEQWKISGSSGVTLTTLSATGVYTTIALTPNAAPDQNLGYVYSHSPTAIRGFGISVRPFSPLLAFVWFLFNIFHPLPNQP